MTAPLWLARHEAGHVVAAIVYGAPIRAVTITEDGGRVDLDLDALAPIERATVFLAGAATGDLCVYGADLRGFRAAIAEVPATEREEAVALAQWNARSIAERNSDIIETIAASLAARGRLTGREIAALIAAPGQARVSL